MKVTDEMVERGLAATVWVPSDEIRWIVRTALEAALADVPDEWMAVQWRKDAKAAEAKLAKVREWLDNGKPADFGALEAILGDEQ